MNVRRITPGLAATLRSLAVGQLQMQASRSATLDTVAIGVMGVDLAAAAIVVGIQSSHHLWIASLAALGLSFSQAIRVLLLEGAKRVGPLVVDVLGARTWHDDASLEVSVLESLALDMLADRRALAHKKRPIRRALVLLALAIALELAGAIH
jgi:hypothetical protein